LIQVGLDARGMTDLEVYMMCQLSVSFLSYTKGTFTKYPYTPIVIATDELFNSGSG